MVALLEDARSDRKNRTDILTRSRTATALASVLEPFLTDQWYVNAKKLAVDALAAVKDGRTKFVPKNWEKTYFDWLEKIEPWCISRQLWWGHQIPAWYGPTKDEKVIRTDVRSETICSWK